MGSFAGKSISQNSVGTNLLKIKERTFRLNSIYQNLLENSNVKIFKDYAEFVDQNTLKVGNIFNQKIF